MSNCIVITYPHSLATPGGGTRSCLQIANQLKEMGHEVILVPVSSNAAAERLKGDLSQVIPALPNCLHFLLDGHSIVKIIQKLLQEKQVDAVLSWEHEGAFLTKLLSCVWSDCCSFLLHRVGKSRLWI